MVFNMKRKEIILGVIGIIVIVVVAFFIANLVHDYNKDIINTIILDIIKNSYNKPYIKLSDDIYKAIFALKDFNYEKIYKKANTKEKLAYYKDAFNKLYSKYLSDLEYTKKDSNIYTLFINNMNKKYLDNTSNKRKVIDFIAGMTDDYFIKSYEKIK